MKVTMLLADAAQAIAGKLYILGGGWSVTGPKPTASAIALKLEVPWDEANRPHALLLELLNADGRAVMVASPPDGEPRPVQIRGEVEVGRPPGLTPGTALDAVLAINLTSAPALPAGRYVWRLSINGQSSDDWQLAFTVRAAAAGRAL